MSMKCDEINLAAMIRKGERGGSKVTLAIVVVVLGLGIFAGYNFIPIAFADTDIKAQLQVIATNAVILPSATTNAQQIPWATLELKRLGVEYEIPEKSFTAEMAGPAVRTSIKYHRVIPILPFGIYNYEYDLNYSVLSAGYDPGTPGAPAKR